ncbi:MAG: HD domain-containing protein [Bacteroidota bacterium]
MSVTAIENEPTTLPIPKVYMDLMHNTEQNPKYHAEGNVLNHTLLVLREFYELAGLGILDESEKEVLYWAALLHDIGKPSVTRWDGTAWRAAGHEAAGVPIARNILLQQQDISPTQRQRILDLVKWHHIPLRMGLRKASLSSYENVAFRTDIRLLGLFSLMDLKGRICENANEIKDLLHNFTEVIVPQIEATWGTFQEIQTRFQACCPLIKNQIWSALQEQQYDQVFSLLSTGRFLSAPRCRCFLSIGTPRSGKSQFIQQAYNDLPTYSESRKGNESGDLSQGLKDFLSANLSSGQSVVVDGCHLDEAKRQKIADFIRHYDTEIQYLYFERSLSEILELNSLSVLPLDSQFLREAYSQLHKPHPWEAHGIEIV